jgi:hypothetical protein
MYPQVAKIVKNKRQINKKQFKILIAPNKPAINIIKNTSKKIQAKRFPTK